MPRGSLHRQISSCAESSLHFLCFVVARRSYNSVVGIHERSDNDFSFRSVCITSTDSTEAAALRQVFGERAASLAASATKSMHGHQLGAAGAVEAIVTVLALREQAIPPTAHLDAVDPACTGLDHVTAARHDQPLRAALSNSFAFGGSNAVLAFRAVR